MHNNLRQIDEAIPAVCTRSQVHDQGGPVTLAELSPYLGHFCRRATINGGKIPNQFIVQRVDYCRDTGFRGRRIVTRSGINF